MRQNIKALKHLQIHNTYTMLIFIATSNNSKKLYRAKETYMILRVDVSTKFN
jgi:hypothetical protein